MKSKLTHYVNYATINVSSPEETNDFKRRLIMGKRTRFDGTEMSLLEKISKLTSGKNSDYSQSVLQKICMYLGTGVADYFLFQVDQLGLFGQRTYKLHEACNFDLLQTAKAIGFLYDLEKDGLISQDDVIAAKEADDFKAMLGKNSSEE